MHTAWLGLQNRYTIIAASVKPSVGAFVTASVGAFVAASVGAFVGAFVAASVGAFVGAVVASVGTFVGVSRRTENGWYMFRRSKLSMGMSPYFSL